MARRSRNVAAACRRASLKRAIGEFLEQFQDARRLLSNRAARADARPALARRLLPKA
jgi:hypothetical protein